MQYKNVIKFISFLIGLLILLNVSSYLFAPKNKAEEGTYKRVKGFLSEPQNTLDYLSIGDSECKSSISPMEIWKEHGYAGYNCGVSAQHLRDTYYLLEELLKNQSPKVVLLETNSFARNFSLYNEFLNITDRITKKFFPVFEYHNRWQNLSVYKMKNTNSKGNSSSIMFKGLQYSTTVKPYTKGNYIKRTEKVKEIKKIPMFYLNEIVNLCNKKDIKLILYCAPSPLCWSYQKHNATADFAIKNGLPFIDLNLLNDDLGIDWSRDTRDKGDHLNYYGAKKVTSYIGAYLSAHTNLKDHRKEKSYVLWNKTLEEYLKLTKQSKGGIQ